MEDEEVGAPVDTGSPEEPVSTGASHERRGQET